MKSKDKKCDKCGERKGTNNYKWLNLCDDCHEEKIRNVNTKKWGGK